jgi:hypothetical protein
LNFVQYNRRDTIKWLIMITSLEIDRNKDTLSKIISDSIDLPINISYVIINIRNDKEITN